MRCRFPACKKCTYQSEGDENTKEFRCQECISSEYKLENFECHKCNELNLISNCIQCHFEGEDQHPECDTCEYGYYVICLFVCLLGPGKPGSYLILIKKKKLNYL